MLTRALAHAATAQDTAAFAAKTPAMPTSTLPKRGITLSKLGFGAYRVNDTQDAHRRALEKAVASGVNVIDTSAHFGYGKVASGNGQHVEKDTLHDYVSLTEDVFSLVFVLLGSWIIKLGASETFIGKTLKDILASKPGLRREVWSFFCLEHVQKEGNEGTLVLERNDP